MRRIDVRALQKRAQRRGLLAACSLLLAAACANEGIWPTDPLPEPPPGPPPPAPSFHAPTAGSGNQDEVLTNIEREELEARLTKLAKDRETGVRRRIQKDK